MAQNKSTNTNKPFWQLAVVLPVSIMIMTMLVALLAYFLNSMGGDDAPELPPRDNLTTTVEEAVAPVAQVAVATEAASAEVAEEAGAAEANSAGKSGEEVVKAVCAMCHATGMMESPKIGDAEQWAPRIAQGYDTLVNNAINGIRNMPAKGGNSALSDAEVKRAVAYMANQSGADFKAD